jgi:hypothetical protein
MTRVGVITWTSKGFTVAAAAPSPPRRPERARSVRVARSRRPTHTTTKELSRR